MASGNEDNVSLTTAVESSGQESVKTGRLTQVRRDTLGGNKTGNLNARGVREDKTTGKCFGEEGTQLTSPGADPPISEGSQTFAKEHSTLSDRKTTIKGSETPAEPNSTPPDRETTIKGSETPAEPYSTPPDRETTDTNRGPAGHNNLQPHFHHGLRTPLFYICAMSTATGLAGGILGTIGTLYFAPAFVNVWNSGNSTSSSTTLHQQMNTMTTTLDQCLKQNAADKEKIKWLEENMTLIRDDMYSNYSNVELKSYILDGRMEELTTKFVSKEWIFLILLMGIVEVAVMAAVWKMWISFSDVLSNMLDRPGGGARRDLANGGPRLTNDVIRGDGNVLNRVSRCHLENRVCVVGFHSDTTNQHHAQVETVLSQNEATRNIAVKKHYVKGHELLLSLPPCKLYFVFVDFNERHVILEDPTKGLGDLRLTTVQAIRKMGGDVLLIYSRDGGSRSLPSGALYNSNLTSIKNHPELRRLDNDQRMFSVFGEFNQSQIDRLVRVVKEHMF